MASGRWLDLLSSGLPSYPLLFVPSSKRNAVTPDHESRKPAPLENDHSDARTSAFQHLVKRLILQLRYGCTSSECSTPHCLSCKKRFAKAPLRRPNPYTARMQAYALASRKDPYSLLCPNPPKTSLDDFNKIELPNLTDKKRDGKSLVQSLFSTKAFQDFETGPPKSSVADEQRYLGRPKVHCPIRYCDLKSTETMLRMKRRPLLGVFSHTTYRRELLFDNLWHAIGDIFPRKSWSSSDGAHEKDAVKGTKWISNDYEAAHIIVICFLLLSSNIAFGRKWSKRRLNTGGLELEADFKNSFMDFQVETSFPPALRMLDRLVRAIAARRCDWELLCVNKSNDSRDNMSRHTNEFPLIQIVFEMLKKTAGKVPVKTGKFKDLFDVPATVADWMEALIRQKWNGEFVVSRWDAVGGALDILSDMAKYEDMLDLRIPMRRRGALKRFDSQAMDVDNLPLNTELSTSFMEYNPNPNTKHILEFPMLFTATLVQHFRAINYATMFNAFHTAGFISHMSQYLKPILTKNMQQYYNSRLKVATSRYLVLNLRRDHMLEDAFDQLRGRERRELLRPLKVRLGIAQGMEIGLDQGGVAQEFFRLVFAKIFDPDYGMFVLDSVNKKSWFRSCSPVELYKFELVGLLFSLAVYNGAVATANFPRQLYVMLLSVQHHSRLTPESIEDGFPEIAQGLRSLLNWDEADGKVEDVFVLEYSFNNDPNRLLGDPKDPTTTEPTMVSASNREAYVDDYLSWLTYDSVKPQYEAFARGFHALVSKKALSILTPEILQNVVEGSDQVLDIKALRSSTKVIYWPGGRDHPLLVAFWDIVGSWEVNRQRQLLKFVTASDRVPAMGYEGINFVIEKNGGDSEMLPSASTCFGILLLPEYSSAEKLRQKLVIALENCEGFGVP